MLDEPFAALDANSVERVIGLISATLHRSAVLIASPSEYGSCSEISFERGIST
jgi:ABC-type transport system involved in cytochrome c biogenesis ATPase subunit